VLVIDGGKIVQDGSPQDLALQTGSRYGALVEAEEELHQGLWSSRAWRQLRLEHGQLSEFPARPRP
jgi:hypothetical protein